MSIHSSRPERFSVVFPDDGSEPYAVLPLGSIWPSHPEAAALENLIWDSGHRDRAWGMTVDRCVEARAVATRHASGANAQGGSVSPQVRNRAKPVLEKLNDCLRALAAEGVAGAAEALASESASDSPRFASALSSPHQGQPRPTVQRPMFVLTWNPRPQDMDAAGLEAHQDYGQEKIRSISGGATSGGWWSTGTRNSGVNVGDEVDALVAIGHPASGE